MSKSIFPPASFNVVAQRVAQFAAVAKYDRHSGVAVGDQSTLDLIHEFKLARLRERMSSLD
jgi:hypothetical protein